MHYSTSPNNKELASLVRSIWCYQSAATHKFERVLPGVTPQLLINLYEDELRHWADLNNKLRTTGPVAVQGILTQPVTIDTKQKRDVCGVEFTSTGLSAFCNTCLTGFTDALIDANTIWGSDAHRLHIELSRNTDPVQRCIIIESFLLRHLQPHEHRNLNLINTIIAEMNSGDSLASICTRHQLSQRALHALFERRTGVRPKTFNRVSRFGSTLKPVASEQPMIEIAADCGFSDQAHFSREFRAFTGQAPTKHQPLMNENRHAMISTELAPRNSRTKRHKEYGG